MNSYQTTRCQQQRIRFFVNVIGKTLILFGIATIIVQIVKFFLEGQGNYGLLFGSIIGFALVVLGQKKIMTKITEKVIYSGQKKEKILIFILPLFLTLIVILIQSIVGAESWKKMNTEGGIIEYGTSFAYILAFIFAIPIGKLFLQKKHKLLGYFYYLLAVFCLFIALEELSWGQRFIGVKSPEFFETYNSKSELSLHNLVWLETYLYYGFIILGILGGLSWLIVKLLDRKRKIKNIYYKYLFPSWFISSFFLLVCIYFSILQYLSQWENLLTPLKEFMELTLSLGFFGFIIISFFRQSFDFDQLQSSSDKNLN